jgi:hypothetical protein
VHRPILYNIAIVYNMGLDPVANLETNLKPFTSPLWSDICGAGVVVGCEMPRPGRTQCSP